MGGWREGNQKGFQEEIRPQVYAGVTEHVEQCVSAKGQIRNKSPELEVKKENAK